MLVKKLVYWGIFGSLFGAVMVAWISPAFLAWYFAPPVENIVNCSPAVTWALDRFRMLMVVGAVVGGVVFMLLAAAVRRSPKSDPVI